MLDKEPAQPMPPLEAIACQLATMATREPSLPLALWDLGLPLVLAVLDLALAFLPSPMPDKEPAQPMLPPLQAAILIATAVTLEPSLPLVLWAFGPPLVLVLPPLVPPLPPLSTEMLETVPRERQLEPPVYLLATVVLPEPSLLNVMLGLG